MSYLLTSGPFMFIAGWVLFLISAAAVLGELRGERVVHRAVTWAFMLFVVVPLRLTAGRRPLWQKPDRLKIVPGRIAELERVENARRVLEKMRAERLALRRQLERARDLLHEPTPVTVGEARAYRKRLHDAAAAIVQGREGQPMSDEEHELFNVLMVAIQAVDDVTHRALARDKAQAEMQRKWPLQPRAEGSNGVRAKLPPRDVTALESDPSKLRKPIEVSAFGDKDRWYIEGDPR